MNIHHLVELKSGNQFLMELDQVESEIEFEPTGPKQVLEKITEAQFLTLVGNVKELAGLISGKLDELRKETGCDQVSIDFGYSLEARMNLWVLKSGGNASISVSLSWK